MNGDDKPVEQPTQGQQQVPTSGGGGQEALPTKVLEGLQSRLGGQEKLQMPGVNPAMKEPGAKDILIGGALNMFVPFLGTAVMQHSKQQKERQVNDAVNEFMVLDGVWDAAWQRASVEAKGDPQKTQELAKKYASEDPRLNALFSGPAGQKRLKNFAKVFQQPWMNDGKSTAHTEGLKRFLQLKPMSKALEGMAEHILGRKQQQQAQPQGQQKPQQPQQGQPQQQAQQQSGADMLNQIPRKVTPPDEKMLAQYSEYLKAVEAVRNRYDFKFDSNGTPFWFDKRTHAAGKVEFQDKDGNTVSPKMLVKGRTGIATVNGVPIGVYGPTDDGTYGVKTPDMKSWNGDDAKQFEAAKVAYAQGEANKNKRIAWGAEMRAKMWGKYARPPMSVYDAETGNMVMATQQQITEHPEKYAGASPAMQLTNRLNLFNEISGTEEELKRTISGMGMQTFSEEARAKISAVLSLDSQTPGVYKLAMDEFLRTNVADSLTREQVEYVTALAAMEESALSLRTLGGMGQGSDMMRAAILRMVPGAGTPSGAYALRQLQLFDIEMKGLKKAMPGISNLDKKDKKDKKDSGDKKQTLQEFLDQKKKERAGQNPK